MSGTVSFMNIREAIRSNDEQFFSAIEAAVAQWMRETDVNEVRRALFSPDSGNFKSEIKAAA